jgi:hypothetical protein
VTKTLAPQNGGTVNDQGFGGGGRDFVEGDDISRGGSSCF